MGTVGSVPTSNELERVFPVEKDTTTPLGLQHGVPNTTCGPPTKIFVKEKFWSLTGDSLLIKYTNGTPFGHNIKAQGRVLSARDRVVLLNGNTNQPVVVSMRKWNSNTHAFELYTTHPVYKGQVKSEQKYDNDQPLYTYANIVQDAYCCEVPDIKVTITNDTVQYTLKRCDQNWLKKRAVYKDDQVCALIEGGTWEGRRNTYKITINPGIDQCLMVMLCSICDQMDEYDYKMAMMAV